MTKKNFFFLCVLVFAASQSYSAMLTQTQYFSGASNLNGTLTFNQFDNSEGNLQSVAILFYLQTIGGQLILDNDSSASVSGTFQFGAYGSISSSDVILLNSSYMSALSAVAAIHEQSFNLSADNGDGLSSFDSSAPDGLSYSGGIEIDSVCGLAAETFWSMSKGFLGTSTININYAIMQWVDYGSLKLMSYAVNPVTIDGFVTLIYTYESAPEPATILFFGLTILIIRICPKTYPKKS